MKLQNIKLNNTIIRTTYTFILILVLTLTLIPSRAFALNAEEITKKMDYGKENLGKGKNGNADEFNFNKTPQEGMFYPDLHYYDGGGKKRKMELGNSDLEGPAKPVIVFIHGGGWRFGGGGSGKYNDPSGKKYGEPINYTREMRKKLAKEGFASIWVDYTLGPNGVWRVFNDSMNALENIRNNAKKYNIDPSRMVAWGDSAGGSIVTRLGASGKSGLAAVVGWSAPMNSFRDMEHSVKEMTKDIQEGNPLEIFRSGGLLIGLDHSTCVDTSSLSQDIVNNFVFDQGFYKDIAANPTKYINNPQLAMQNIDGIIGTDVPMLARAVKAIVDIPVDTLNMYGDSINIDIDKLGEIIPTLKESHDELKQGTNDFKNETNLDSNSEETEEFKKTETKTPKDNSELEIFKERINKAIEGLKKIEDSVSFAKTNRIELEGLRDRLPESIDDIPKDELKAIVDQFDATANSLEKYVYEKNDKGQLKLMEDIFETTSKNKDIGDKKTKIDDVKPALMNGAGRELSDTYASAEYILSPEWDNLIKGSEQTDKNIQHLKDRSRRIADSVEPVLENFDKVLGEGDLRAEMFRIGQKIIVHDLKGAANEAANSQFMVIRVIGKCAESFIAMSPAVFADPKSPPMILLNGQSEPTVPPGDALEMRDKLRQFGTKSKAVILPGDNHMGCDARAIRPSVDFISEITNPVPESSTPPQYNGC